MPTAVTNKQSLLVVSNSATEAALVQSMLEGDFERVLVSAEPDNAVKLFLELQAPVLVLAFRDLRLAEDFYLGIYRHGIDRKFQVHPHRTIMLCGKDDVRKAYELCRSGLADDYVQFWPMTYDAPRLAMSVHRSLQESMGHPGSSHSAAAFAVQARQLLHMEQQLTSSLQAGALHTAATGAAVLQAEAGIDEALGGLAAHLLDHGVIAPGAEADAQELARQVAHYSADAVLPHVQQVTRAIEPLAAWMQQMEKEMDPHLRSTRALLEMAASVRPCVLVVDDDEFQRQMAGQILEAADYQVKYAGNGGEALSMLSKMRPDLILMDLVMPDMSGMEVIERIKSEPSLAAVPVIMITGKAEREVVLDSVRRGAADFIVKPVDRHTLLGRIAQLLAPRESEP
jgi:CheY-like chemotaxis protein